MLRTEDSQGNTADRVREAETRPTVRWEWNRRVGWTSVCVGAAIGLVLGLWSFNGPLAVPRWLGGYGDLGRRMVRLGHIACFGLGILNVLLAAELRRLGPAFPGARIASWTMNFGNVFLPLTLFAAAAYHPLKYAMSVPAFAVFLALALTSSAVWRAGDGGGSTS